MTTNIIHLGDCLEVLKAMPDDSVDLVFTSPPYEDARLYNMNFKLKGQAWVDWALEGYLECVRVCKGLVAWVVEGRTKNFRWSATPVLLMADLHRTGVKLRKPPAFCRVGIAGGGGPDWWRNDYEFVVCSSKGKLPWSNNLAFGHTPKYAPGGEMSYRLKDGSRKNQWGGSEGKTKGERKQSGEIGTGKRKSHRFYNKEESKYIPPEKANPGNVIRCIVGGGQMGSKLAHDNEAPFPESLAERFIVSFCPPGGIVLDPFCGSGTTLSVAVQNNRKYIGIDIRENQIELSKRRVEEAAKKVKLWA